MLLVVANDLGLKSTQILLRSVQSLLSEQKVKSTRSLRFSTFYMYVQCRIPRRNVYSSITYIVH